MKSKAIFMALLAFAFGAQAVPVSSDEAKAAARAWAESGDTFNRTVSPNVLASAEIVTTNGVTYHAVRMLGGGTVFLSSDTDFEPIVGFSGENTDFSKIDPKSPLWALLNRDAAVRKRKSVRWTASASSSAPLASAAAAAASANAGIVAKNRERWSKLIAEGTASARTIRWRPAFASDDLIPPGDYTARSLSDVRVSPLVQTKWSQGTAQGKACYNYYTPNGSDPSAFTPGNANNIVCGCVATATAQVMRYFEWPQGDVSPVTKECSWGVAKEVSTPMNLTTQGGAFDWENMTLNPQLEPLTEDNCKAIGKLTSDVGIAVRMMYNQDNARQSGAFSPDVRGALVNVFGYSGATYLYDKYCGFISGKLDISQHDEIRAQALQKVFYTNLDAGMPMVLGITGHEVVADGYGYSAVGHDYVHVNFGWAGQSDFWYLLPELMYDTNSQHQEGGEYKDVMVFDDVTYNIFTNQPADSAVASGRCLDDDGNPVAGLALDIYNSTHDLVASVVTKESGVWGAVLPPGSYTVEGSLPQYGAVSCDFTLSAPVTTLEEGPYGDRIPMIVDDTDLGHLGNSWGNDLVFVRPCVRNQRTAEEFSDLDKAILAAEAGDVLEVFDVAWLKRPETVDKNLTILCARETPEDLPVTCRAGARLEVAPGCELFLSNVVFSADNLSATQVAPGATLALAGKLVLGPVVTADADGIRLAGALDDTTFVTVDCAEARVSGTVFGAYSCDQATAETFAAHFLNPYDEDLGGVAKDGQLVWDVVPVNPLIAIAYFTGDEGANKEYYRKIASIFEDHAGEPGDIVVLKDCVLKWPASVTSAMRLLCTNEAGAATITFNARTNATFYVEAEASLNVSNLVFVGASGDGAFRVRGGSLTLDADTLITGCGPNENGKDDNVADSFAVTVGFDEDYEHGGKLTMLEGSVISNCTTFGYGGGVYVGGGWGEVKCGLDLFGGKIVNCTAGLYGGGVFADYYSNVRVKGASTVSGCVSDASQVPPYGPDNLYVCLPEDLELADEFTGRVGVRTPYLNDLGDVFGVIAEACAGEAASNSVIRFFSDENPGLHGAVAVDEDDEDRRVMVWSDEPLPLPSSEFVVARVIYTNAVPYVTNEFATVHEAFDSVRDNAIVEIVATRFPTDPEDEIVGEDEIYRITNSIPYLTRSVTVCYDVLLRTEETADGFVASIYSKPAVYDSATALVTVTGGGKLTLSNIGLEGRYPTFETTDPPAPEEEPSEEPSGEPSLKFKEWAKGEAKTMVFVDAGGELMMEAGASVAHVKGSQQRDSVGISVYSGKLTMLDGSSVTNCTCSWKSKNDEQSAPAGGVIVEGTGGLFVLNGGRVTGCGGILGGGVYVATDARIEISGASEISGNYLLSGGALSTTKANLSVGNEAAVNGQLVLAGEFTGSVGVLEPRLYDAYSDEISVETNVFGTVAEELNPKDFVASAAKFTRDASGATGKIAVSGDPDDPARLVWSTAFVDGVYTDPEGKKYYDVSDVSPVDYPQPVVGLVYNGNLQTGVVEGAGFKLTGNAAVAAGGYTATATLEGGWVWSDGKFAPTNITWTIAKATYDMSGVVFTNVTYVADGTVKSNLVDETTLPAGVVVANYVNNGQVEVGVYTVTAQFGGDVTNYEPIPDMTATLTITEAPTPPPPPPQPQWDVITNHPTPIAFQSIDRVGDTEWKLVITNRVEYCNYRLIWTEDLTKGFTETGKWEHAVGPAAEPVWTTNVITTGGAWFWRAEGTEGTNMVPHVEK